MLNAWYDRHKVSKVRSSLQLQTLKLDKCVDENKESPQKGQYIRR